MSKKRRRERKTGRGEEGKGIERGKRQGCSEEEEGGSESIEADDCEEEDQGECILLEDVLSSYAVYNYMYT